MPLFGHAEGRARRGLHSFRQAVNRSESRRAHLANDHRSNAARGTRFGAEKQPQLMARYEREQNIDMRKILARLMSTFQIRTIRRGYAK